MRAIEERQKAHAPEDVTAHTLVSFLPSQHVKWEQNTKLQTAF